MREPEKEKISRNSKTRNTDAPRNRSRCRIWSRYSSPWIFSVVSFFCFRFLNNIMFFYRILSLFPSPPFLLFNSALNFLHTSLNDESNLQLVTLINVLQQTQKKRKKEIAHNPARKSRSSAFRPLLPSDFPPFLRGSVASLGGCKL